MSEPNRVVTNGLILSYKHSKLYSLIQFEKQINAINFIFGDYIELSSFFTCKVNLKSNQTEFVWISSWGNIVTWFKKLGDRIDWLISFFLKSNQTGPSWTFIIELYPLS